MRPVENVLSTVTAPPLTEVADELASAVLPKRLAKDVRRLESLMERVTVAEAGDDAAARSEAWHDARKAAKRLRYAAETLRPAWGKGAKRVARAAKALTTVLGERQDTEVVRAHLPALAAAAEAAGEPSYTYGLLHARQAERDRVLAARTWEVWEEVRGDLRL